MSFLSYNNLEDVNNQKYKEIDQIRQEYPNVVQLFKNSHFPAEIIKGLSMALDDLGDSRSSCAAPACWRTAWAPRSPASTRACSWPTPEPSRSGWTR